MVAPEGGKEPLRAEFSPYSMGSDHDVYQDSSFKIPAISLNDWPDRYIHTNFDSAANIDPTKLKRAAFIGAASGYSLAIADANSEKEISRLTSLFTLRNVEFEGRLRNLSTTLERCPAMAWRTAFENEIHRSLRRFLGTKAWAGDMSSEETFCDFARGEGAELVFRRNAPPKGPLARFGYGTLPAHCPGA